MSAITGDYRSLAEAAGEIEPRSIDWTPGVDFDPSDADDMDLMSLVWDREAASAVRRLERDNATLRARVAELTGAEDIDEVDPADYDY